MKIFLWVFAAVVGVGLLMFWAVDAFMMASINAIVRFIQIFQ
jgi:hypothetical protein